MSYSRTFTCNTGTLITGNVSQGTPSCNSPYVWDSSLSKCVMNGVCGSASGVATASYPTANLCSVGTVRDIDYFGTDGTYDRRCLGSNGGTNVSCSAPQACSGAPDIVIGNYTLQACNLGATVVGTGSASYGYYFQRGNNYGFANAGSIATAAGQVNAIGYGPGNYYHNGTFRIGKADWSSNQNSNLR
jgi:hypothetical protein